jgi:hypothetical protein
MKRTLGVDIVRFTSANHLLDLTFYNSMGIMVSEPSPCCLTD